MVTNMRGLNTFIADIRHCQNKELEIARCEKEQHKIRNKFSSSKGLTGYHKKKYLWKLLYMYVLGYDLDFGIEEGCFLINSIKFSEKFTGYMALSMLSNMVDTNLYKTIANAIKGDLNSQNELYQCLALAMVGATTPEELVDYLKDDIQNLAFKDGNFVKVMVQKKAILTCLRMYRKYQQKFDVQRWLRPLCKMLDQKVWTLGYLNSIATAIYGIANDVNPDMMYDMGQPIIIQLLHKLVILKECPQEYQYYATPNPWLQVKLLKLLQTMPPPNDDTVYHKLIEILVRIIKRTEVTKKVNKNNADHGILFEAANLVIYYNQQIPNDLRNETITLLGIFITVREPNIKYLALETIAKFHNTPYAEKVITEHYDTVLQSLKDQDISIRRRALDILYLMCTQRLAPKIVNEILKYVEETDLNFKEELVLKIAILAEKFAADLEWYINVVVQLLSSSGEFVTEEIWFRIIQIITGFGNNVNVELQRYASLKLYNALNMPHVHETLVKIGSYILAEFGGYLVENGITPQQIFECLNRHFLTCSEKARAMLVTAYTKLGVRYPEILDQIQSILLQQTEHFDADLQQRSVEYQYLIQEDDEIRRRVFEAMPAFAPEIKENNPLLKSMLQLKLGLHGSQAASILKSSKLEPTLMNEIKRQAEKEINTAQQSMQKSQLEVQEKQKQISMEQAIKEIKLHPAYSQYSKNIITTPFNIVSSIPQINFSHFSNAQLLKALITSNNGQLYDSPKLKINYKSEYDQAQGRIAMQFVAPSELSNLSLIIQNSQGLLFNISTPKILPGQPPQIMIMVQSIDSAISIPQASVFYNDASGQQRIDLGLPILNSKFINPIQIPLDVLEHYYDEYLSLIHI
eukprot:TRINITY_DN4358_c0_g1_i10.p1 TRINITY_DN4358_c0_g1~~TRINITY_DN4358_c0_g1_i10.p1  ORF type:complete len:861 (-),score=104.07 TRINITY_DN4358_c0_g1_i10:110-2692(-)